MMIIHQQSRSTWLQGYSVADPIATEGCSATKPLPCTTQNPVCKCVIFILQIMVLSYNNSPKRMIKIFLSSLKISNNGGGGGEAH